MSTYLFNFANSNIGSRFNFNHLVFDKIIVWRIILLVNNLEVIIDVQKR